MIFGRRKNAKTEPEAESEKDLAASTAEEVATESDVDDDAVTAPVDEATLDAPAVEAEQDAEESYDRAALGPFDVDEVDDSDAVIDLGAIKITPVPELELRLEVEEATQRVVAVTMDYRGSSLQLQAFAAPKSSGLWAEIREQIHESVQAQGGMSEELKGVFGTELLARLPVQSTGSDSGFRVARFIGVDGPRWFLRGVVGGDAATDPDAAAPLEEMFQAVVVERGEEPLPPRDLLHLRVPKAPTEDESEPDEDAAETFAPGRRGPELTETR